MGNVNMEARQIHYRGGNKPMSVEEAIKEAGSSYVLPVASAETLGGVKVGDGLTIENGVLSADRQTPDFSVAEFDTGLKWTDGKKIYGKVVYITTDAQQGEKAYSLGLQANDTVIYHDVSLKTGDGNIVKNNYFVSDSNCFVTFIKADNTINMVCSSWGLGQTATVIVYYTKTESDG